MRIPGLILLLCLASAAGCSDENQVATCPPIYDAGGGTVNPGIVVDREVQRLVEFFQISVVKDTTKKGNKLSCDDFPGLYRVGSATAGDLVMLDSIRATREQLTSDPVVKALKLPANQGLIIVVLGVAKGYVVARGCSDGVTYKPCSRPTLEIDVIATTGSGCNSDHDCELGMICNKGQYFNGGYCGKTGCAKDGICPPGSVCVAYASHGGLCARKCGSVTDCKLNRNQTSPQACECRLGSAAGGMASVCVHPLWNTEASCPDAGMY